jgi:hypothetical protein
MAASEPTLQEGKVEAILMPGMGTCGCTGTRPGSGDTRQLRSLPRRKIVVVEPDPRVQVHVAAREPDQGPGTRGGQGAHRVGE